MQKLVRRYMLDPCAWLALGLIAYQYWILFNPDIPLVERATHLVLTLAIAFLSTPFLKSNPSSTLNKIMAVATFALVVAVGCYYYFESGRLSNRIENVSPIETYDIVICTILVGLLLEAVRRTVGYVLLIVIAIFLLYGVFGYLLPGEIGFSNISWTEWSEIFGMTTSGILGVTTATSTNFIFYFIVFGVVYSSVGGGRLFIELAIKLVGKSKGGGAKVAIIGSSLMGTISGSAVANVTATGVFTIPLMQRTGIKPEKAAAYEAIASTGGQLMPPIMGIAAFVMAEMLATSYTNIALAGIFPAVAFYFSLFVFAGIHARKTNTGTLNDEDINEIKSIFPRLNMLLPPVVLVAGLMMGYSAQISVFWATITCFVAPFLSKSTRYDLKILPQMVLDSGIQAAKIACPIMAIGLVVSVAIQSNLALKFASGLIDIGGGSYTVSLIMIVMGCIIMGMGLPTVAAYIIGAVLYVPALKELGISELQAHFFVMYFCVLSMVTPPVSLASFAAAGVANTDAMRTSVEAFKICAVAFLIPFAFLADPALLFVGSYVDILFAGAGLIFSTVIWAIGVIGFAKRRMNLFERIIMMACGFFAMISQTASDMWLIAIGTSLAYLVYHWLTKNKEPALAHSLNHTK
ncbi:MAG: TRAP transporter fused permease subunit [Oceanospirillaceae bacterium]|nr:TRAP transporter fused permease subunit [Oceanospirillaceae bacterium]